MSGQRKQQAGFGFWALVVGPILVGAFSVARAVGEALSEGDSNSLRLELLMVAIGFGILLLAIGGFMLVLVPGHLRERALRRLHPDAVVFTARGRRSLVRQLVAAAVLDPQSSPGMLGFSFSVLVTPSGYSFWKGVSSPQEIASMSRKEFDAPFSGILEMGRFSYPAMVFRVKDRDAQIPIMIASEGSLGMFPRKMDSIDDLVSSIQSVMSGRETL